MQNPYIHGTIRFEVDSILINHEPTKVVIIVQGSKDDAWLAMVNIAKERIYVRNINLVDGHIF
jgi:hypothetical protein